MAFEGRRAYAPHRTIEDRKVGPTFEPVRRPTQANCRAIVRARSRLCNITAKSPCVQESGTTAIGKFWSLGLRLFGPLFVLSLNPGLPPSPFIITASGLQVTDRKLRFFDPSFPFLPIHDPSKV